MSTGVPMSREVCREFIEMVENAAPEEVRAVRESFAAFRPIWEAMTDEERANYILGITAYNREEKALRI